MAFLAEQGRLVVVLHAQAHATSALPEALLELPAGSPDPAAVLGIGELPGGASVTARFRRRADGAVVEAEVRREEVAEGVLTADVFLDPVLIGEGRWQLRARLRGLGAPRTVTPEVVVPLDALVLRPAGLTVDVAASRTRALELRVQPRVPTLRRLAMRALRRLRRR